MEQSSGKKERLMLAAGLAAALILAAAQYLSPLPRLVWDGKDVPVAVLGPQSAALLVYHPSSGTVNAFSFPSARARKNVQAEQRARDLAALAGVQVSTADPAPFYISVSTAPDLDALWGVLNGWRGDPRRFLAGAAWARSALPVSNISPFGMFSLFSEFSGLSGSDFFLAEIAKGGAAAQEADEPEEAGAAPRVEVFNASGRQGLAAKTVKFLRAAGFDVITQGSKPAAKRTSIEGYSKDAAAALRLRAALGLEELEIHVKPRKKTVADAAVVLGADFDSAVLGK